jgi:hypothetical protein
MLLRVLANGDVHLENAHEFRSFKLIIESSSGELARARSALSGIATLPSADTAWVSQQALRQWPSVTEDRAWQSDFAAMIEKARPHGWIDDATQAIKAHIEWAG